MEALRPRYCTALAGLQMGAMYLTAAGATQDEAIGELPELPYPIGPNQNTPVTMLPLQPPLYEVKVRFYADAICRQSLCKLFQHTGVMLVSSDRFVVKAFVSVSAPGGQYPTLSNTYANRATYSQGMHLWCRLLLHILLL